MTTQQLKNLIEKYLTDSLSEEETGILRKFLTQQDQSSELSALMDQQLAQSNITVDDYPEVVARVREGSLNKIRANNDVPQKLRKVYFFKRAWLAYAAAILLLCGAGTYFWFMNSPQQTAVNNSKHLQTDIPPGGNKATLTLADGSIILLDSVDSGNLTAQGHTQIIKLASGALIYQAGNSTEEALFYNTVSTPKGGQYQITLPDGSKVWLNASSSIKFPTAFSARKRDVEINGEVYFEVKENPVSPFSVIVNGTKVNVLGTSFNINAYSDEDALKTTLIQGRVQMIHAAQSVVLVPGQQAQIPANSETVKVIDHTDIDQVMAWKNGFFNFNDADLPMVMRQLERWYDIKVKYEKSIPRIKFKGELDKGVNLSEILRFLSKLEVKYRLEEKTLIVIGS